MADGADDGPDPAGDRLAEARRHRRSAAQLLMWVIAAGGAAINVVDGINGRQSVGASVLWVVLFGILPVIPWKLPRVLHRRGATRRIGPPP